MLGENIFIDIVKRSLIILVLSIIVIFIFFADNPKPYITGLIFGMIINLLNFRLMSLSITKALSMDLAKAQRITIGNYMMRYIIYGIVLYVATIADYIDLLSVVIGFFTVKLIIISDTFYDLIKGKIKDS